MVQSLFVRWGLPGCYATNAQKLSARVHGFECPWGFASNLLKALAEPKLA